MKGMIMELRDTLLNAYQSYCNDYLTIDKFAEHNGLTTDEAKALLALAKTVSSNPHPEA